MNDWDRNRAALRHHLKTDKLENFLRWSTVEKTMFVGNVGFVFDEFDDLMSCPDWQQLTDAIREPGIGNPKYFMVESPFSQPVSIPEYRTSGNLIHQLYHLKQWLDRSKKTINQLSSIAEVGAGYGAMALICRRLGFRGQYNIIDLPELITIQRYYLGQLDIDRVKWFTLDEYMRIPILQDSLLIACHSIGEMPVVVRDRLLSQVTADAYLFASSYEFEGVDNATWLRRFADGKPGYEWAQWAHPWQENALYSVGIRL